MLGVLLRRRWFVLLPAAAGAALAVGLAEPPAHPGVPLAGAVAGMFAGVVAVAALQFRQAGFSTEDEVLQLLALPVLGSIPVLQSARLERADAWRRGTLAAARWLALIGSLALSIWRLRF